MPRVWGENQGNGGSLLDILQTFGPRVAFWSSLLLADAAFVVTEKVNHPIADSSAGSVCSTHHPQC
eukprot:360665-Amphidinium_carterae.2